MRPRWDAGGTVVTTARSTHKSCRLWQGSCRPGRWSCRARALAWLLVGIVSALGVLDGAVGHAAEPTATERELTEHVLRGNREAAKKLLLQTARARSAKEPNAAVDLAAQAWTATEARGLAQLWLLEGNLAGARRVLAPHGGAKADPETLLVAADLDRLGSDAATGLKALTKAATAHPRSLPLRVALGEALVQAGKAAQARKLLDPLADLYQDGAVTETDDLVAVARSLALNGYFKDALSVLDKAEDGATEPAEQLAVQLALGELFLQKYNYRDADVALRKVLAINPHHPAAQTGQARIDLASDGDESKARQRLDKLLEHAPGWLPAVALRADLAMQDEDLAAARTWIDKGRKQRPDHPDLLYALGALAKLSDDAALWQLAVTEVDKVNPADGNLYYVTAEHLEHAHRYREVRELLQEALKRDGDHHRARAALGMAWARVAEDAKAKKELEAAFAADPYDVRTANQLTMLYDDVLKHMPVLSGPLVDLRVHKKERKVLERSVLPFLQQSIEQLDKAYGFSANRPLVVEIFPTPQQFAVRTVGLPQMGAHAVCFGHLVTSRSPVGEPFNWKLVLFHELSHVYHIQVTDGRVPRWLTEGLAMMETVWANPRWRQANDRRAWDRLKDGKLAKIARFNLAFSQARSMQDILDAYDQAMRQVDYLAERFGRDKVRQLVLAHKTGKPTTLLVQEVLGTSADDLDKGFAGWLGGRLGHYAKDFQVDADDLWPALGLAGHDPDQPDSGAAPPLAAALRALRKGEWTAATTLLNKVKVDKPDDGHDWRREATYLLMDLASRAGNQREARQHAQWLIDQPAGKGDGLRQRAVLFLGARNDGDVAAAVGHLRAAQAIAPLDPVVAELTREAAVLAASGAVPDRAAKGQPWFKALANDSDATLAHLLRELAEREAHDGRAAAALGRLAWARVAANLRKSPADPATHARAIADMELASSVIDERDPANPLTVLLEARAAWAKGQPRAALPLFRLAAERATTPAARTAAWCEAADAAKDGVDPADRAEADRHCGAGAADKRDPRGKETGADSSAEE